ncbi:hypothetical protein COCCADRAFT_70950, partial [Bipolaris zeicola 26-R-13]
LFPWYGTQKEVATQLWLSLSSTSNDSSGSRAAQQRTYIRLLSQALICQKVYHQPFDSPVIHFLATLGIYPETSRLRDAPEFSTLLSSLIYCVRALTIEIFLPVDKRAEQGAAETGSFLEQRASYLVDGSYSPMSTMLSLLVYAKFIALRTPSSSASRMWWLVDRQTFYIKGQ